MPKVLVSDKLSEASVAIFKKNHIEVDVKTSLTPEELKNIIGNYDGLAIRSNTKVTKEIIDSAKRLKVIGRAGIGVDNVDIPYASSKGIIVMNTPFGNTITTAEHTIALLVSLARQIPSANSSTHSGKWEKNKYMGVELFNKVLGLIGCGNIGSIVANRAQGLKMKVSVYDPFLTDKRAEELNIKKVALDELLKTADFISLHTPLTESTKNILSFENLSKTKKGVRIINCARGGLVDEKAVAKLIQEKHIAGAAFDVFEVEPAKESVLFGLDEVICTPHLGASTNEAQENVALQVAEQISDYLNSGVITNALNVPSVSEEDAKKLNPYIKLGDLLGRFVGQLAEDAISTVKISYKGKVSLLNVKPITASITKGILTNFVEDVNIVNAPFIAKERNTKISEEVTAESDDFNTLVSVEATTNKETIKISGTLFNNQPRIVQVNNILLESALGKFVIFVHNEDKPGLIGNLGRLLGDNKINIANFNLGRGNKKGEAISLVEIDEEIENSLLAKIAHLPTVKRARFLRF